MLPLAAALLARKEPRLVRFALLVVLLSLIALYWRVARFNGCELVGHDAHWVSPTLRICRRQGCDQTWRRDMGDIAATTTNQNGGW